MYWKLGPAYCLAFVLFATTLPADVQAQVSGDVGERLRKTGAALKSANDVIAPRAIYAPNPEFSEAARAAGYQGTCVLSLVVGVDGKPRDVGIVQGLGMQLDQKAVDAVRQWTFEPARKNGKAVPFRINVEISFRLYDSKDVLSDLLSTEQKEEMFQARSQAQSRIYRASGREESRNCLTSMPAREQGSGPLVRIAELEFEGELHMAREQQDQIAASVKQQVYSGNAGTVASETSERVKAAWQNSGYFGAEVHTDIRVLTSGPASERVAASIQVHEGQQYRLEGIAFRDNRAITNTEALRNLFPLKDGDVFDRSAVLQGLEKVRQVYAEYGYLNLTFVPDTRINESEQTVSLEITLAEGKQFYVSRIDVAGLDESTFQGLMKEMVLKPGDVYNQRLVDFLLQHSASLFPAYASREPRYHLKENETEGTVAVTYDFRGCQGEQRSSLWF